MPEVGRAAAPLVANARQDAKALQTTAYDHSAVLYRFLSAVRVYLELADALPKPSPFAEEARKQLAALREQRDRLEIHFRALLESKELRLRSPDRDNLARYAEANKSLGPAENRVVFLGDSITDGWRLNEYFPGKPYVNRGISGQASGEMLGRMKADVIDLKPVAVVVLAGTNDLARGTPLSTVQNNLTMIADLAVTHGIKPIFASILPIHDYHKDKDLSYERSPARPPGSILAMNQWIQGLCKQRGFTYLDYFSAMTDEKGFLKEELADDGLHPNAAGYRIMGPLAQAAIDRTIAPPAKPRRGFGAREK
jgi:lysophospholipase L1-like esterase